MEVGGADLKGGLRGRKSRVLRKAAFLRQAQGSPGSGVWVLRNGGGPARLGEQGAEAILHWMQPWGDLVGPQALG